MASNLAGFLLLLVMYFALSASQQILDDVSVEVFSGGITVTEILGCKGSQGKDFPIRLPRSLKPIHYLVRLQPFINGNLTVNGYVEITFEVKERTNTIILHINGIITKNDTTKVYLMDNPNQMVLIVSQDYDHEREFYTATVKEELQEGKIYTLSMNFEGFLNDNLKGFYRSSYKNDDGTTKLLATTQFQPTDARKAFPCFDEPSFKAKFTIEIAREEGMKAISNMPVADTVPVMGQEGWFWDCFDTSLPMSTYLVAFIVSDFDCIEAKSNENYKFRVCARKNAISNAKYALELGPKVSKYFEDFFNVPFPLPKQAMVAVPDFSAGAMENWGLIIYRESALLYKPKVAKAQDKMSIASVIAHELAHQWFGDLVTPFWWTDLWLNEGFASYMEYVGLRDAEASMKPMDQFVVNDLHSAFTLDALETSHPINIPVENPDEINGIFDRISYAKGASIIRMMSGFLTEETFKNGLSKYLMDLSYSNAEQDDLWRYLTDQAHADGTLDTDITVKDVMDTWTLQMGYPVISVQRNQDGTATLMQKRFLLVKNQNSIQNDIHNYKWWVPITFTSQSKTTFTDTTPRAWMTPSDATKVIKGMPNTNEWVIFNLGQYGYYRVNYDAENWAAIASQLATDPSVFPDSNRAQIIDDSLHLARAGQLPYETVLNFMTYLKEEREFVPIKAALNNFGYIKDMLSTAWGYGFFRSYILSMIVPLYNRVNFTDSQSDSYLDQLKRVNILKWACDLEHDPCIGAAVDLYDQWMDNPEDDTIISPNLKPIVYCIGIREGGHREWKFIWDKYKSSLIATEQKELLQAMGCSRDISILEEFLNRSLSPDQGIKKQMVTYIIPAIAKNTIGKFVAWEFMRNRWEDITDYFSSQSFVYDDIIQSVTQSLNTRAQLQEMMWFKEHYSGKFASAARSIEQATENMKNNVEWMEKYSDVIIYWLKDNGYKSGI